MQPLPGSVKSRTSTWMSLSVTAFLPQNRGACGGAVFWEEEKKRPRPVWPPLSCSSSALMTGWVRLGRSRQARAKPEETPGMLSRRGFAHARRRISEADAEDAMEVRAVRKARAERDVGDLERGAGWVRQQPVQFDETPFENVLIERLGRLFEQTVDLTRCDPEREPDSLSGEIRGGEITLDCFNTASVRAALRPRPLMSSSESRSAPTRSIRRSTR